MKLISQFRGVLLRTLVTVFLIFPIAGTIQSQQQKREIISHAFTKNRQNAAPAATGSKGSQKQSSKRMQNSSRPDRTYKLASSSTTNAPLLSDASVKQLGVTVWRLRSASASDKGPKLMVKENGASYERVPERVEADTRFRKGDYVRLSIESPHSGYLYVINRELFADGTTGDPILIYPWEGMLRGEHRVRAGRVVDIPAQDDVPSYFTAKPARPDQIAELLTFIVTKSPLNLPLSHQTVQISGRQMALWEKRWKSHNERFEMDGGAGQTWTQQEQQAAQGLRARRLTRDDPAPQTIYRIAASDRLAFMVNLKLSYE